MNVGFIANLLGRRLAWRLGRSLYMAARGEVENTIARNGEAALIRDVARAFAGPALTMWDVGANLGEWSAEAIDASRGAIRLEIFEPAPVAREGLQARFAGHTGIAVHPCALADAAGTGRMEIVGATAGTNALVGEGARGANLIEVTLETGDRMIESLRLDHVHLVKIDAEGFDFAILQGMRKSLSAGRFSVVQFEYNHRWLAQSASLAKVFALVENLPYTVARVTPGGLELYPAWNGEMDRFFECNYALVHRDAVARLATKQGRWDESNILIV